MIEPFRLSVKAGVLDDLSDRLNRTRWPEAETTEDWSQGVPLSYARELCDYWAHDYDWRRAERQINAWPQFRMDVDGLGIHFIHVRSQHPDALPLIISHGWPGSVLEFLDVLGPLTDPTSHGGDPQDAFHVVCPSLPGYAFSDKPKTTGWGVERIAHAWAELMARLGYQRYGAQGGDWGSHVSTSLSTVDPSHLVGIHLTMPIVTPDLDTFPEMTTPEKEALDARRRFQEWGTGYSQQQSTRPQTLGYSLVDSPAGLCAWIIEKYQAWSDCGGHPENAFTKDQLLDNVMMYWLTATGVSSARLYWESFNKRDLEIVTSPVGCSIFPKEIFRPSRRWCEQRFSALRYWNELDRGGHFAALEQPSLFVEEVRAFFRGVR